MANTTPPMFWPPTTNPWPTTPPVVNSSVSHIPALTFDPDPKPGGCSTDAYRTGCKCDLCWERHNFYCSPKNIARNGVSPARLVALGIDKDAVSFFSSYSMEELGYHKPTPGQLVNGILPPQICTKCNFKNDFAGPEHLQANGTYICRSCKT